MIIIDFLSFVIFVLLLKRSSAFGFFSPYFLVSFHFFMGICVRYLILKYSDNSDVYILHPLLEVNVTSYYELFIFFVFFVLIFELFFLWDKSRGKAFKINNTVKRLLTVGKLQKKFINKLIVFSIFCLGAYFAIMIPALGGVSELVHAFAARVSDNIQGLGYTGILSDIFIASITLVYLAFKKRIICNKFIVFNLIIMASGLLIIQGGRGNLMQFIISLMLINNVYSSYKNNLSKLILILIFVIFITIGGLATRMTAQRDISLEESLDIISETFVGAIIGPFALYDHYMISKAYVGIHGYNYGLFYIENLLRPIPRSIWADKPEVLGKLVRLEFWGDSQGGIPPGLLGEAYIAFGIVGNFIVGGIFALMLYTLNKIYIVCQYNEKLTFFSAILVPYVCFNLVRGGVDVGFTRITIYLAIFIFISFLSKIAKFSDGRIFYKSL